MNRDDDPQLWDFLGKSATPPPSAFFARNVLREIRETQVPRWSFSRWFALPRAVPAAAIAALLLAGITFFAVPHSRNSPVAADQGDSITTVDPQDLDLLADLDDSLPADDGAFSDDDDVLTL